MIWPLVKACSPLVKVKVKCWNGYKTCLVHLGYSRDVTRMVWPQFMEDQITSVTLIRQLRSLDMYWLNRCTSTGRNVSLTGIISGSALTILDVYGLFLYRLLIAVCPDLGFPCKHAPSGLVTDSHGIFTVVWTHCPCSCLQYVHSIGPDNHGT